MNISLIVWTSFKTTDESDSSIILLFDNIIKIFPLYLLSNKANFSNILLSNIALLTSSFETFCYNNERTLETIYVVSFTFLKLVFLNLLKIIGII